MKIKYKGITILVKKDYEQMSQKAAQMLASQITLKSNSVLGLATGSTPEGMYKALVDLYNLGAIDFEEIVTFNLDEYVPIAPQNPQSYAYYMAYHLFGKVNINKKNIHIPSGLAENLVQAGKDYDAAIDEAGGVDLQVLGIGNNGHIGFNEPDFHFECGTHQVDLDEETIKANARFFDSIEEVPRQAISMGMRNIMHAKKVILLANGKNKAPVLKEMLLGQITPRLPASILQLHNDVTIIVDQDAASDLLLSEEFADICRSSGLSESAIL